ncbi:hypothetical protein OSG_eHP35_00040 [environmental Halophage eHP-35]|nr:hypothetical protein OSG_eHP35_00040 [environmental Halophage eHP-35]
MTNNNYRETSDGLEVINYMEGIENIRRITHAIQDLETAPSPEKIGQNKDVAEKIIERQIKVRKKIMAGLDTEIEEYRELREKL